ncbi:hypothetical protein NHQ30_009893 [Ciborinia camelliae]|nr:hypothetical protein NHQ30_009893 [Ciborinia camelliae]
MTSQGRGIPHRNSHRIPCVYRTGSGNQQFRALQQARQNAGVITDQQRSKIGKIPLRPVTFPHILPDDAPHFSGQGWSTLTFSPADLIHTSSQKLLQASRSFFDLPPEYKSQFITADGTKGGWNRLEGEKEFITLRDISTTPPELQDAAKEFWDIAGDVLNRILGEIACSLAMNKELLTRYSEPCSTLQEKRTASMIRLFRYEGDAASEKVVCEPHRDLGLLSLSISDVPGLEVLNGHFGEFFPIEQSYEERDAGTLLVGRELEFLTNGRYRAAGHLVRMYPVEPLMETEPQEKENGHEKHIPEGKQYRYSIVFVLRGHEEIEIDTDELRTPITGRWEKPMRGMQMGNLYRRYMSSHININVDVEERQEQKKKLRENKKTKRLRGD